MITLRPPALLRERRRIFLRAATRLGVLRRLLPLIALAMIVPSAHAQAIWLGPHTWPAFTRRDVPRFARELDLDDGQVEIIEVLLADYLDAFHAGAAAIQAWDEAGDGGAPVDPATAKRKQSIRAELEAIHAEAKTLRQDAGAAAGTRAATPPELRERIQALRAEWVALSPDPETLRQTRAARQTELMQQLAEHMAAWTTDRAELDGLFVSAVGSVLSPAQSARWDALVETDRRTRAVRAGVLSGERVDLAMLVEEVEAATALDLRADPAIAEALAAYDVALDDALTTRDDYLLHSHPELLRATATSDRRTQTSIVSRRVDLRVAVRDVNDAHLVTITATLPEEPAAALVELHGRRAYPRAYRPTELHRTFAVLAQRSDLPPPVRDELTALEDAFRAELHAIELALVDAIRRAEPERYRRRMDRASRGESPVILRLMAEREAVMGVYAERVRGLLADG